MENYLNHLTINTFWISLTRFRLFSHDLLIETGRHQNIPRANTICQHCNMNIIENEYHFLLVCQKYNRRQIKYLPWYYCHWPTLRKCNTLMSCTSPNTVNNLSKYLYFAFKERTSVWLTGLWLNDRIFTFFKMKLYVWKL